MISTSSARGRAQERDDGGIAAVAAVPVGHPVDVDRAEKERQRGRGHHHFRADFRAVEDPQLAGVDVGGRDEQVEPVVAADRLEVDEAFDHVLERIDVERVEIIRRQHARHRAEPQPLARDEREQALDHAALQVGQVAVDAHRAPEIGQPLARLVGSPAREPVGQHDRVDRARRSAGNTLDLEAAVVEQLVEDAPGERAVGAAALQPEIDGFAPPFPHPSRPPLPARRGASGHAPESRGLRARLETFTPCRCEAPRRWGTQCGDGIAAMQY